MGLFCAAAPHKCLPFSAWVGDQIQQELLVILLSFIFVLMISVKLFTCKMRCGISSVLIYYAYILYSVCLLKAALPTAIELIGV